MRRKYYGYDLISYTSSSNLVLYETIRNSRPCNSCYQSLDHDVERRWYLDRSRMISRLLELGFTRREIDNTQVIHF